MTDRDNNDPLSSEDLLRQARAGLGNPTTPESEASPPAPPVDEATAAMPDPAPEATPAAPPHEPLIPADFQPAAARGSTPPPPQYEMPSALEPDDLQTAPRPSFWSQLWAKRGWIVGGVFLVIALVSILDRSTSVEDLSPGDCFDDPGSESVTEVDTLDCTEPHDYEMFATVVLVGNEGAWPGDLNLFTEADEACFERFLDYTGITVDDEVFVWDYTTFVPERASWDDGGRDALCTLFQVDANFNEVKATSSARAGA